MYSPFFSARKCNFGKKRKKKSKETSGASLLSYSANHAAHSSKQDMKDWYKFKIKNAGAGEYKKDGAGRVVIHKEFQVLHSYTVECSCNMDEHW